tara:strand:- start:360804 stop:361727 length:924 start_codon:yes stop_codon:yes gene_type:complete
MKKLIFLIALTAFSFSGNTQDATINWMSIEEAVAAQAKEPRKIMMDMYTTWCGPCKMLDKNTFQNNDVAAYVNKNYYAVKFNAEGDGTVKFKDKAYTNPNFDASRKGRNSQHELAAAFGVSAYPTIVFLDEKADLLTPLKGYHTPTQLELFLKVFATDAYKKITSKEDFINYQKNFNSEFGTKKVKQTIASVEEKKTSPSLKKQPVQAQPTIAVTTAKSEDKKSIQAKPTVAVTTPKTEDKQLIRTSEKLTVHTVEKGETLGKIAEKYYKNARLYVLIFNANKAVIKDPNSIYLGQTLTIPIITSAG